jgi:alpha-beta hydrolase superfamily lysophospholipase
MGLEAAYSTRALRDLAARLAANGWVVLRLDYAATGDSSGTWTDQDLVETWRKNVREAIEYVRALGPPRVAVVGLRIGATLAAAEVGDGTGVDDLVLWDPCVTGKAFLREMRALWAFRRNQAVSWGILGEGEEWGSGEAPEDGSFEAPGAVFSAQTVSDLQNLAISPGEGALASRELVLIREGRKLHATLAARRGLPHTEFSETGGQDLLLDADAITPEPTFDRIVAWLDESAGQPVPVELPEPTFTAIHRRDGRRDVVERPLEIGPTRLFGLLSEPADMLVRSGPTVIFLTVGRIGHQGPTRLWVELARSWSSEGVRCMRLDISGLGDSPTRPQRTENVEFPLDALDDLRNIRRFVAAEFGDDMVIVGLCSGGYHAIEAALDEPVTSVCLINPALAAYRWNDPPYRRFEPEQGEGDQKQHVWGATRPWVSRLMVRLSPLQGVARKTPGARWVLKRFLVTESPASMLESLEKSGVAVLLVAGSEETRRLFQGEERRIRALTHSSAFRMEVIPGLEHTLLERSGRERVADLLYDWVVVPGGDDATRIRRDALPQKPTGQLASAEGDRAWSS